MTNPAADLLLAARTALRAAGLDSGLYCTPGALTGAESGAVEVQLGYLDGVHNVCVRMGGELVGTWTPGTNAARLTGRAKRAAMRDQEQRARAVLAVLQGVAGAASEAA